MAIEEAVERFEVAVESAGGDLMVDEGPNAGASSRTTRTSSCRSGSDGESVVSYLDRIAAATDRVRHHRSCIEFRSGDRWVPSGTMAFLGMTTRPSRT